MTIMQYKLSLSLPRNIWTSANINFNKLSELQVYFSWPTKEICKPSSVIAYVSSSRMQNQQVFSLKTIFAYVNSLDLPNMGNSQFHI